MRGREPASPPVFLAHAAAAREMSYRLGRSIVGSGWEPARSAAVCVLHCVRAQVTRFVVGQCRLMCVCVYVCVWGGEVRGSAVPADSPLLRPIESQVRCLLFQHAGPEACMVTPDDCKPLTLGCPPLEAVSRACSAEISEPISCTIPLAPVSAATTCSISW